MNDSGRGLARLKRKQRRDVVVRGGLIAVATTVVLGSGFLAIAYSGLINIDGITPPDEFRSYVSPPVALPGPTPRTAIMSHVLFHRLPAFDGGCCGQGRCPTGRASESSLLCNPLGPRRDAPLRTLRRSRHTARWKQLLSKSLLLVPWLVRTQTIGRCAKLHTRFISASTPRR